MEVQSFAYVYVAVLAIYFAAIYAPNMHRYRRQSKTALRSRPLDMALDFATFAAWQLLPLLAIFTNWLDFASYHLPNWAGWLGAFLALGALLLLWRAYADLGRNWSPRIELMAGQQLVTHGIYGRLRHPIYAGMWLWALANPLLIWNWIAGPAMLVTFLPLYLTRAPREEAMLLEQFGEEYRRYRARTGALWPRIR
jgi:protein-S-isoprenylcysteine O-methyltransferase Ste14